MVRCAFFIIAAVGCIALASADEQTELQKSKALLAKCLKETSTTVDDLKAFINGEPYPDGVKCLFKCYLLGEKAMTEDGTINVETMLKYVGEARRTTVEKCVSGATNTDLCERALQYKTCFLANDPEYFKATVSRITA